MNQSEELALKLQTVKLAIAEVQEYNIDSEKQRYLKLKILYKIESAILKEGEKLNLDLQAA
tara:strand:- start:3218 stop:3400 length:183 start_codon:yes stop_codon:yes gene_type:complete